MNGSAKFTLSQSDLLRIAKGAALAAAGAAVTFLTSEVLPQLDESTAVGALIAAAASTALNALRKWLTDTRRVAA
jgi:hypothetical protein